MIRIDLTSVTPIYEQIIDGYKEAVMKGYLREGDAVPSVRKLALDLSVTPNTVAKAYAELERQKLIVTVRGKGTFIAKKPEILADEGKIEELDQKLKKLVIEYRLSGLTEDALEEKVKKLWEEFPGEVEA
ncbi:MAG: GntR family transcriptional regulator [Lachnospiraceae bacterium]|nr:GntR family transcriptional regulator [Lachnospiraceae bacterium]